MNGIDVALGSDLRALDGENLLGRHVLAETLLVDSVSNLRAKLITCRDRGRLPLRCDQVKEHVPHCRADLILAWLTYQAAARLKELVCLSRVRKGGSGTGERCGLR